jgi:ABC-2 type transport system permease protein
MSARPRVSLRRLVALCRKEGYQIVRDPSSLIIAFLLPIGLLLIFGFAVNLDATRLRIGVHSDDGSADAARFVAALAGSPYVEAVPESSRRALEADLVRGDIRGYVLLPEDFGRRLAQAGAPLLVVTDGAEPNTANFVQSYVVGVYGTWLAALTAERGAPATAGPELVPRFWFNPAAVSRNFLVPGSIAVVMTVIGALLTSLVVAREWERGTMEALLATPVTRAELLLSKVIPYYALGMVAMLVCLAVARFVLEVPFHGSLAALMVFTTLFLGSALGIGLLLSTTLRNQFNAAQAALNLAYLPATMLSGFVYEIASMPAPVRAVTYLLPARYFVSALQTLFQAGWISSVLWRDAAFLVAAAIVFLGLTAFKTRRHLD